MQERAGDEAIWQRKGQVRCHRMEDILERTKMGRLRIEVIPLSPSLHSGGAYWLQVLGSPEEC